MKSLRMCRSKLWGPFLFQSLSMEIWCATAKFHENHKKHSRFINKNPSSGGMYFLTPICTKDWGGVILQTLKTYI